MVSETPCLAASIEHETQPEPRSDGVESMRGILATAGTVGLASLLAGCPPPDPEFPDGPMPVLPANLKKLLARTSFGINREEALRALELGYDAYLEFQLDHLAIDDRAVERKLAALRTLDDTPLQRFRAFEKGDFTSLLEFYTATLLRGVYSRRQLFERMVEFWSDHFNIFIEAEAQRILKPLDDARAIRPHALGTFPELLKASATSPAMLLYLSNASSLAGAPNQNYARELMELHTLGVDNYTQEDVKEVARALTGWSINYDINSRSFGAFQFYPEAHDTSQKQVLGRTLPAGRGLADGEDVLNLLSLDPEFAPVTARRVSRKLAVHFWGYDPPEALIDDMVAAWLATDGDIKSILRVVLGEAWLMQAPPKLKRPCHYALSALRARPGNVLKYDVLAEVLRTMEHLPFNWAPPNGYPDTAGYWGGYLMPRWTFGVWLVYDDQSFAVDWTPYREAPDMETFLDQLNGDFFGHAMPADHRATLEDFLGKAPQDLFRRVETISLAIGSPAFQWY